MTTQGIGTGKPPAAAPLASHLEIALANKLLLSRVQTFVTLAVVLSGEGFSTNSAYERTLIGVCS
jgi:hypothetical protein